MQTQGYPRQKGHILLHSMQYQTLEERNPKNVYHSVGLILFGLRMSIVSSTSMVLFCLK